MTLTVRAAAKINLLLGVGAPRPDGFHTLVTVYQAVSLYDDLTVTAADDLTVATDVASYIDASHLPPAGHNIVDRAAAGLAALHGRPVGAEVRVDKSIPIAGGLAGGSADGAAALVALDRVHDLRHLRPRPARAGRGARQRRAVRAARRHRARRGARRGGHAAHRRGLVVVGGRAVGRGDVDAGGLPPLRRGAARRAAGARPARRDPGRAGRAGTRAGSRPRCTTTSSRRRSTCGPTSPR